MRLLLFLMLSSLAISAQDSDTVLITILSVGSDTEKVNRLYERGFSLRHANMEVSESYALLCEKTALSSGSDRHLAFGEFWHTLKEIIGRLFAITQKPSN
jgi:hypothetical protein